MLQIQFLRYTVIEKVYLPKSLNPKKCSAFYTRLEKVKTISFGGSQADWKKLTKNINRMSIDAEDIVFDVNYEDMKQKLLCKSET